jgi:hypothetical protein
LPEAGSIEGNWRCDDFGSFEIVPSILVDILETKKEEALGYDRTDIDKLWLLICATNEGSSGNAGFERDALDKLKQSEVIEAARLSGFDRVFFWSMRPPWHYEIPIGRGLAGV